MKRVDVVSVMPKMRIQLKVLFLLTLWVACSDAWFWGWTGTTTLAPTVEHEGSGGQAGSGEMPTENISSVGAEIIDEAHGIQNIVQTLDESTEAPRLTTLTPTTEPETERSTKRAAAETPSSTREPGNDTSSLKGMGSEASDDLRFTGNTLDLGSESELASDSRPGLGSESGFATGAETSWGSGFEPQGPPGEEQQRAAMPTDHRGLDSGGSIVAQSSDLKSEFQGSAGIIRNETDGGRFLDSTEAENRDSFVESQSNTRTGTEVSISSRWNTNNLTEYSDENSSIGSLLNLTAGNNSVRTTQVPKDDQDMEVTQLPAGESAANQAALLNNTLTTGQASVASRTPSTTRMPSNTITKPTIDSVRPDTVITAIATQHAVTNQALAGSQTVENSQFSDVLDATEAPSSQPEPSLSRETASDSWATETADTEEAKEHVIEPPECLLLDTALPFCSSMVGQRFVVPNYLNQSSVEEVQVLLEEWTWLLRSHCHRSLEQFFCLLLVPKCGSLTSLPMLPCRGFCEVLRDSCWTLLDEGRLPVECHTLPDEEDDDGYQCLSVCNQKGNHWFE